MQRNFERLKVALGECGRAYGTSCHHEHSCVRCPLLRIDPAQRPRLIEIRDNLTARIAEAEGLRVSLAHAQDKLAQLDGLIARRTTAVALWMPSFRDIVGREAAATLGPGVSAPDGIVRP